MGGIVGARGTGGVPGGAPSVGEEGEETEEDESVFVIFARESVLVGFALERAGEEGAEEEEGEERFAWLFWFAREDLLFCDLRPFEDLRMELPPGLFEPSEYKVRTNKIPKINKK